MAKLHISISAEPIFHLGEIAVTNSMLTGVLVSGCLIGASYLISKKIKSGKKPKGAQNIVEMVFEGLLNLMIGIAGETRAKEFFPVVATLFLYILFSNWSGLLPGVGTVGKKEVSAIDTHTQQVEAEKKAEHEQLVETEQIIPVEEGQPVENAGEIIESQEEQLVEQEAEQGETHTEESFVPYLRPATADLNATLALALFSVVGSQIVGYKHLKLSYFKRFLNFTSPINFFLGFLDIISELSRIISFAFRLFGNIFAGEVLLSVMLALLPFLGPLPFIGLEIFVGFIQALVFAVLTLVFWNMATQAHGEEH